MVDLVSALQALPSQAPVEVFTDGASKGNPGPAGWAYVVTYIGQIIGTASGTLGVASNVYAEMTAAIEALRVMSVRHDLKATLTTDNQMLQRGASEWLEGWKGRGWKRSSGRLENVERWQSIDSLLCERMPVQWRWVRGHSGDRFNELADALASDAALRQ